MDSSPSSSCSSRSFRNYNRSRDKFLPKTIAPAIRGKSCPICFEALHDHRRAAVITACLHVYCLECIRRWSYLKRRCPLCNTSFDSLLHQISFSSRKFLTEKLPPLESPKRIAVEIESSSREWRQRPRVMRRARAELDAKGRRTGPLPWRRTFGRPGSVPCDVIAERKIEWRASIYERSLRAVPLCTRNSVNQDVARDGSLKERMVKRIEPWIRRELQAILGDPEPSIIVHVASSLFIASLERNFDDVQSDQLGVEDKFLSPLRRFLHNSTNMFWHELRCFAESSLTMEAYDGVVSYIQSS